MTKDEILAYAMPSPTRRDVLDALASQHASVAVIEAKITQLKSMAVRAEVLATRFMQALVIPSVLLLSGMVGMYLGNVAWALCSLGAGLGLIPVISNMGRHFDWKERCCKNALERLQPIAGTDACQEALQYLESDAPGVATWRDIALSERNQLYQFDVSIMRRLDRLEQYRLRAEADREEAVILIGDAERRRLNEEACRKVHGLAPLSLTSTC